jgi:hypothetical protein
LGGEVVPGKIAQAIGDKYDLQSWSSALFSSPISATISRTTSTTTTAPNMGSTAVAAPMGRQKSIVDESVKRGLLKVLLEVYMNDGYAPSLVLMACLVEYSVGFLSFFVTTGNQNERHIY